MVLCAAPHAHTDALPSSHLRIRSRAYRAARACADVNATCPGSTATGSFGQAFASCTKKPSMFGRRLRTMFGIVLEIVNDL